MSTLLIEIGCEELPANACDAALAQAAPLVERLLVEHRLVADVRASARCRRAGSPCSRRAYPRRRPPSCSSTAGRPRRSRSLPTARSPRQVRASRGATTVRRTSSSAETGSSSSRPTPRRCGEGGAARGRAGSRRGTRVPQEHALGHPVAALRPSDPLARLPARRRPWSTSSSQASAQAVRRRAIASSAAGSSCRTPTATWRRSLGDEFVVADADERARRIEPASTSIRGWADPGGVLAEVVHLAEWPSVLRGSFPERFLELPDRVIITVMQSHQRYLPLLDGTAGRCRTSASSRTPAPRRPRR